MSDDLDERVAPPMDVLSKSRLARLKDMGAGTLVGEMAARITELEAENTTLLDLHSKAMKSLTSQVLKRRELEAANAKMRKALLGLLKFHQEGDDGAELPREFWSGNYLDAVEAAEEVLK